MRKSKQDKEDQKVKRMIEEIVGDRLDKKDNQIASLLSALNAATAHILDIESQLAHLTKKEEKDA